MDNDLSAYSGKRRPGYLQMLADLADGLREAVICYHVDRVDQLWASASVAGKSWGNWSGHRL